jgi:hypothetical protein
MSGSNTKAMALLSYPAGAFDPNTIAKDLVWLGWTTALGGQAVAVLKDTAAANYYIARMTLTNAGGVVTPLSLTNVTSRLTGIASADYFAVDQQYGYLFYTSGGKLYEYDMDNDVLNSDVWNFGGKTVSMLQTQPLRNSYVPGSSGGNTTFNGNTTRWYPVGYSIILGLYDPNNPDNSGEVHFLKPGALMTPVTEYTSPTGAFPFRGFGKVVDVDYTQL